MNKQEKIAEKQKELEGLEMKNLRTLYEAVAFGDSRAIEKLLRVEEQKEQKRQEMRNA